MDKPVPQKPLVSVVVPIYKVEKYLRQCVESILGQSLKEIEIILVDDGSPDTCPQIVDEYAARDGRVVAIHQPNGGYGRAVNHGIELARGEYIGIIESDDWIEPDMYEAMYANAVEHNSDIVKCGFWHYDSTKPSGCQDRENTHAWQDIKKMPTHVFDIGSYPQMLIFHSSLWASLYRADFIKGQRVIESAAASYQDFPFMIESMCRAKRISVVPRYLLHYRMEAAQGSSTMTTGKRLLMMPTQCMEGKKLIKQYGMYEQLREEFYYHSYLACIGFFRNIDPEYREEYFSRLKELFADIRDDADFRFRYFSVSRKRDAKLLVYGGFLCKPRLLGWLKFRSIRRFIFSMHWQSRRDFCFQLLGLQIASLYYLKRPALWRYIVK